MKCYKVKELTQVITIQITRIMNLSDLGAAEVEAAYERSGIRAGIDPRDLEDIKDMFCGADDVDVSVVSNKLSVREVDE